MQFFEKYAAEPSCVDAAVVSDPHAYVRSSDAQFSPHRANVTSAAVAFMHARFHPLATCMAAGRESRGHASGVSTGGLPGVQLFLTSTSLLFSPEGFDGPRGVTHLAQQQLETGLGIQVLPINYLHTRDVLVCIAISLSKIYQTSIHRVAVFAPSCECMSFSMAEAARRSAGTNKCDAYR